MSTQIVWLGEAARVAATPAGLALIQACIDRGEDPGRAWAAGRRPLLGLGSAREVVVTTSPAYAAMVRMGEAAEAVVVVPPRDADVVADALVGARGGDTRRTYTLVPAAASARDRSWLAALADRLLDARQRVQLAEPSGIGDIVAAVRAARRVVRGGPVVPREVYELGAVELVGSRRARRFLDRVGRAAALRAADGTWPEPTAVARYGDAMMHCGHSGGALYATAGTRHQRYVRRRCRLPGCSCVIHRAAAETARRLDQLAASPAGAMMSMITARVLLPPRQAGDPVDHGAHLAWADELTDALAAVPGVDGVVRAGMTGAVGEPAAQMVAIVVTRTDAAPAVRIAIARMVRWDRRTARAAAGLAAESVVVGPAAPVADEHARHAAAWVLADAAIEMSANLSPPDVVDAYHDLRRGGGQRYRGVLHGHALRRLAAAQPVSARDPIYDTVTADEPAAQPRCACGCGETLHPIDEVPLERLRAEGWRRESDVGVPDATGRVVWVPLREARRMWAAATAQATAAGAAQSRAGP